jgi:hypothetical protein
MTTRSVEEASSVSGHTENSSLERMQNRLDVYEGLWNLVRENRNGTYDGTAALFYVKQYGAALLTDEQRLTSENSDGR